MAKNRRPGRRNWSRGIFLALGSIVALFAGDPLLDAYLGLLAP